MKDISLEYCHIYTDEVFGKQHALALEKGKEIFDQLVKEGKTVSRVIMIDDYNPVETRLDETDFKNQVSRAGMLPDIYVYESQLIHVAHQVLKRTEGRVWSQYSRYLTKYDKYPCSFLIACWYALRLGIMRDHTLVPAEEVSHQIISVLPERFVEVEMLSDAILSQLGVDSGKVITRIFY